MAAQAHDICERFLKQIVSDKFKSNDKDSADLKESLLRTYSLSQLLTEIKRNTDIEVSSDLLTKLSAIGGYYLTTRYPGDDSILVTKEILDICNTAIDECNVFTDMVLKDGKPSCDDILNQALNSMSGD